jgi:hypothetical protein
LTLTFAVPYNHFSTKYPDFGFDSGLHVQESSLFFDSRFPSQSDFGDGVDFASRTANALSLRTMGTRRTQVHAGDRMWRDGYISAIGDVVFALHQQQLRPGPLQRFYASMSYPSSRTAAWEILLTDNGGHLPARVTEAYVNRLLGNMSGENIWRSWKQIKRRETLAAAEEAAAAAMLRA